MPRPTEWYHYWDRANNKSLHVKERFQAHSLGSSYLDHWHHSVTHAWHAVVLQEWKPCYRESQQWLIDRVGLDHFNMMFTDPTMTFEIEDPEVAMLFRLTFG